jgi:hypothetical protein
MPSNTNGLPWPLPSEPVRDGAVNIRALADRLNSLSLWREYQSGRGAYTPNAGGLFNLTWPHAFKVGTTPAIFFNVRSLAGGSFIPYAFLESTGDHNGVVIHVHELQGNQPWGAGVDVHWLAIGEPA